MTAFESLKQALQAYPKTWLVTGVAGFIRINLLKFKQRVVGLDNFSTGHQRNLDEVQTLVSAKQWANLQCINGDIRNLEDCRQAMNWTTQSSAPCHQTYAVDYVLHQAALSAVSRSIEYPTTINQNNIDSFLNMIVAGYDAKVKCLVYAARRLPHLEDTNSVYHDFRVSDVRNSQADVSKAESRLGSRPVHRIGEGLAEAMAWYGEGQLK